MPRFLYLLVSAVLIPFLAGAEPLCTQAFNSLDAATQRSLSDQKTKNGVSISKVLKSGADHPDSDIGCYAGDADSYKVFAPVFDKVISEYHKVDITKDYNRDTNFEGLAKFSSKIAGEIISTRVRVARSLSNYPFESAMTKQQRLSLEREVLSAIATTLKGTEFEGTYYSLPKISKDQKAELLAKHLIFKEGDKFLQSAGITNDWPDGRGAYVSKDEKFAIWINEEDHIRVMYLEKDADVAHVASQLFKALNLLGSKLQFAYDPKLGYLNSCPTNIGTAMRVSIHIKVPSSYSETELKALCKKYGLSVRGTFGEHTAALDNVYDISYKKRLGNSERGIINTFVESVNALGL